MGWVAGAPAALPPRNGSGTHCIGDWVGPRTGLDGCGKYRRHPEFLFCALYFIPTRFFVLIVLHFAFFWSLLTTHNTSMPLAGFEPETQASDRPQTLVLYRLVTGIGGIRFPDRPTRSESLYRLSYPGPLIAEEKTGVKVRFILFGIRKWNVL